MTQGMVVFLNDESCLSGIAAMTEMACLHTDINKSCCLLDQGLSAPDSLHPLVSLLFKIMVEELFRCGLSECRFHTLQQVQNQIYATVGKELITLPGQFVEFLRTTNLHSGHTPRLQVTLLLQAHTMLLNTHVAHL